MKRLGASHSTTAEWGEAVGHYNRLTIGSGSLVRRPIEGYPPLDLRPDLVPSTLTPTRIFRTECLDIGFVDSQFDLGNSYPFNLLC